MTVARPYRHECGSKRLAALHILRPAYPCGIEAGVAFDRNPGADYDDDPDTDLDRERKGRPSCRGNGRSSDGVVQD